MTVNGNEIFIMSIKMYILGEWFWPEKRKIFENSIRVLYLHLVIFECINYANNVYFIVVSKMAYINKENEIYWAKIR